MNSAPASKKFKKADSTAHPELEAREFDVQTQKSLEDIDACQNELDSLNEKASDEIINVEQKYNKLRKPHFEKRTEMIKNVPNFWATAFSNHPDLSSLLTNDGDEDCLHHLSKIDVVEADDIKSGFRIAFHFRENPYLRNSVLVKEYHLGTQGAPSSVSTPIEWKDGMSLMPVKDDADGSGSRKRKLHNQSFFEWYNDHFDPTGDNIADIIKDDLWQTPLQYFLTPDIEISNGVNNEDGDEEDESTADEEDEAAVIPEVEGQLGPGPSDPLE